MIYNIVCVGKIKEAYYSDIITNISRSLSADNRLIIKQVADEPIPKGAGKMINSKILAVEGDRILSNIGSSEYVIALCIEGKETGTKKLSEIVNDAAYKGYNEITFIIGGSLGLDSRCVSRADYKLSFSKMTFPHQLMRVMLAEQIKLICDKQCCY